MNDFTERLYWRMLAVSDVCGRGPGTVTKIATLCVPRLPKPTEEIQAALDELVRVGRIILYCEHGVWAYQIVDFDERQPIAMFSRGPRMSRFPAPPDAVRAALHAGAVPLADAVPLFDPDAAPEKGDHPHAAVEIETSDAVPQQKEVGSGHTEDRRRDEMRSTDQSATARAAKLGAGLSDLSLENLGAELERRSPEMDAEGRLLACLPDADRNTEQVLRSQLETQPEHAADHARRELEAAQGVRSPTKYVVGILRNWNQKGMAA